MLMNDEISYVTVIITYVIAYAKLLFYSMHKSYKFSPKENKISRIPKSDFPTPVSGYLLFLRYTLITPPLLFRILQSASAQGTATDRPLFSAFPRSVL